MLPADDREASAGIFVMAMSLKSKLCHSLFEIMFNIKGEIELFSSRKEMEENSNDITAILETG
ncbi:hypothetical protein [Butyrivibrio sp. FC2001]|uniref:hypothetical protein n=1 Tax=Butyrivibrio sp. FC2001 TaxID=1280671 RepID=UPI000429E064|nr:hypothetical protein [Butyrivibrio sp. FC2001]